MAITAGLVAVAFVVGVWLAVECRKATGEADRITGLYLMALSAQNYEQAYSWLCTSTKATVSYEDFRASTSESAWIFDKYQKHETAGSELTYTTGSPRVLTYQVVLKLSNGSSAYMETVFLEENGQWCMADSTWSLPTP